MNEKQHVSVLLEQSVSALAIRPEGIYLDGTYGRGGHSQHILAQLNDSGRLLATDKDPEAIAHAKQYLGNDARFMIQQISFAEMGEWLQSMQLVGKVNGVLLDLGVSSPQLDEAERGFSFIKDGPLDMRMNPQAGQSAAEWLATAKEQDIADTLYHYGEERYSRRIAKAICTVRQETALTSTLQLAKIIADAHPRWEKHKHPATRSFQAIRIHINHELDDLQKGLQAALDVLAPAGRLSVISFHSLEDRIVKRFMRHAGKAKKVPHKLPIAEVELGNSLKTIGKAIRADQDETGSNIRSRSAVLRIAEKVA